MVFLFIVIQCSFIYGADILEEHAAAIFRVDEDTDSVFLRNVTIHTQKYAMTQPTRTQF
jgi:hypothetical protein